MVLMNYLVYVLMMFVVFSVFILGYIFVPYQGVVILMGVSFFCCLFMAVFGRTFMALVVYIIYLGGLVVIFSYCVSVEKDKVDVLKGGSIKFFVFFVLVLVILGFWLMGVGVLDALLVNTVWEEMLCLEVNGGGVFYFKGGVGLVICSWGLFVVLFSILVVIGWSCKGGVRSF